MVAIRLEAIGGGELCMICDRTAMAAAPMAVPGNASFLCRRVMDTLGAVTVTLLVSTALRVNSAGRFAEEVCALPTCIANDFCSERPGGLLLIDDAVVNEGSPK
jgi:hypothetical protein